MSFSSEVKEELYSHIGASRHCQIAEIAAIIDAAGLVKADEKGDYVLYLQDDNELIVRKFFTLLRKAFNIGTSFLEGNADAKAGGRIYRPVLTDQEGIRSILGAIRMLDDDGKLRDLRNGVSPMVTRNSCCKRAFLRDSFLCLGSISDPTKGYHLEYVCDREVQALFLKEMIESFDVEARIVRRKKYFVLYFKEGAGIVDLLNIMEAPVSLMKLENLRILKEMRTSINRTVNCEVANMAKTISAATKQIEDITYLKEHYGFDNLQPILREMAEVRLENPGATLSELGQLLDPAVGKSGVNHRLRKLSDLEDKLRGN